MKHCFVCAFLLLGLGACTTPETVVTRGQQYARLYEEAPASIVIMPPINRTNAVEAKDYMYTTLYRPLCEKGYYVFSPQLTLELFRTESAYDSELFLEGSLSRFRDVLGANAAMFTIIKSWERDNADGELTVQAEYILRSTVSGETLYHREGCVTVSLATESDEEAGFLGALVDMLANTVATALTDHVEAGRKCTAIVLSDMPLGRYAPEYGTDQGWKAGKTFIRETVE